MVYSPSLCGRAVGFSKKGKAYPCARLWSAYAISLNAERRCSQSPNEVILCSNFVAIDWLRDLPCYPTTVIRQDVVVSGRYGGAPPTMAWDPKTFMHIFAGLHRGKAVLGSA